jgi:restriction system protein
MITWDLFMHPMLRLLENGDVLKLRDLQDRAADLVQLTSIEREEMLPSGQLRFRNRTGWAVSYLFKVGAVTRPSRGYYALTDLGRELLDEFPDGFNEVDFKKFVGDRGIALFNSDQRGMKSQISEDPSPAQEDDPEPLDPVEQIEDGVQRLNASIADELLTRLHDNDPAFFEEAVLELLIAMGYGGAEGKATRTQLSNDGGIDGVIDQDALGLSRIYVQAKRYAVDSTVGRPDIQAFVGALQGAQANQGVFLTTGKFSRGAVQYADAIQSRVVLIDGERLARLMIRYGVGVQVERTVEIVKIDEDFFE